MSSRPSSRKRFRPIRILAISLVSTAVAIGLILLAYAYLPQSAGSPNADEIRSLYKLTLGVAMAVFLAVEGSLIFFLVRFRYRKGAMAAQIRGNTNLEIGWTSGAALILVVITVFTFLKLPAIKDPARSGASASSAGGVLYASVDQPKPPGGPYLRVQVNGQQYVWRFTYPNGAFSYDTMVVPTNTTVTLAITAQDVAHSWWIPALGGKFDGIPGYTNYTWFKVPRPGIYPGQCAELCGRGHANMVARVRAVAPDAYQRWVVRQKQDIQAANQGAVSQRRTLSPIPTSSG